MSRRTLCPRKQSRPEENDDDSGGPGKQTKKRKQTTTKKKQCSAAGCTNVVVMEVFASAWSERRKLKQSSYRMVIVRSRLHVGLLKVRQAVLRREEVNIVQERRLKKKAQREMATNTIANDVKTSLQSLEAVRLKSINSERLSSDDIQSARSNLNDIIRTAESIKENLNSSENAVSRNATDDEHDGDEGSSSVEDEEIRTEQNTIASSSEVSEAPKRRLSTPCCIPSPVTDMRVSTSIM